MRPYKPTIRFPSTIIKLPKRIKFISGIVFLYSFGWAIVGPFWPLYFQSKLPNLSQVGLLLSILPFLSIFWVLLWGNLIDRLSKRKLIAVMLLLYFPFSFILLALSQFWQFAVFFVYHSFIATTLWFAMETYLRRHSPKEKEATSIGLFDSMWAVANILGPVLGGLLFIMLKFNSFYAISLFAFLTFVLALFLPDRLSEQKPPRPKLMFVSEIKEYFQKKELYQLGLMLASFNAAGAFLGMLYPILLKSVGASPIQIGLAWAILSIPVIFEGFFSTLSRTKRGIVITLASAGFLFLALAIFRQVALLFLITFAISLLLASVIPFLQGRVTTLMPKPIMGELTSVNYALIQFGAALGPLLGGFLADLLGIHFVFIGGFLIYAAIVTFLISSKTLSSLQKPRQEVQ